MEEQELFKTLSVELEKLKELESALVTNLDGVPEGTLHVTKKKKAPQFYHYTKENKRIYIPKNNIALVDQLAQKTYDQKLLALVQKRILHCRHLMNDYGVTINSFYDSLSDERKKHIRPIIPDDLSFVEEWYLANPGMQNNFPITNSYLTNKKESVRSKSEKIIADMFTRYDIPYVYEPRIQLTPNTYKIADFLVLNVHTHKTYIHEHFGMVDQSEYANKMVRKLSEYSTANIILGDNLIITMESSEHPLDVNSVDKMIQRYLL